MARDRVTMLRSPGPKRLDTTTVARLESLARADASAERAQRERGVHVVRWCCSIDTRLASSSEMLRGEAEILSRIRWSRWVWALTRHG